jgi:hypothetical protein
MRNMVRTKAEARFVRELIIRVEETRLVRVSCVL